MAGPKHNSHSSLSPAPAAPFPSNKDSLCPSSQGSPSPFQWFLAADPQTSLSCSQQLWMEQELQLNPWTCRVWGGANRSEGGGGDSATCTRSGARPAQPRGDLPKVSPRGTGSPIRGLGHRPRAVIAGTVQSRVSGGRRNNPALPHLSHGPAVLDAALGRNARPGQEAAQEALGLSVNPLGNGARAQAG